MEDQVSRPQFKIEEVPADPQTPINGAAQEFSQTPPQSDVSVVEVQKTKVNHKGRRLLFLIPVILLIGAILLASYFTRPEYVVGPVATQPPISDLTPQTPVNIPQTSSKMVLYSNDEYKFSYPDKFNLYECDGSTFLALKNQDEEISLSDFCKSSEGVIKIYKQSTPFDRTEIDVLSEEDVLVSGISTKRTEFRSEGGSDLFVELQFKDNYFILELLDTANENDFNKILGTFSLSYDKTEDWTSYESETYNYSLKYPKDWVLQPDLNDKGEEVSGNFKLYKVAGVDTPSLTMKLTQGQSNSALTASEIISSTKSLPEWKQKPTSEFRSIGGANATVVKGQYGDLWNAYAVIWYKSSIIEIVWQDTSSQDNQEIFDLLLGTLTIR